MTNFEDQITWTQITPDGNNNCRYVCHYLNFETPHRIGWTSTSYANALADAKKLGGKRFHNKQYGGGVVFTSNDLNAQLV